MFPGAHATVYRNEAGEPLGWDNGGYDEPPYDSDDYLSDDYGDEESDEDDGMHDYQDGGDFGTPCLICGKIDDELHW